jgi:PAS domain S-box-containing protein
MGLDACARQDGCGNRGWNDLHLYAMASVALLSGLLLWWTNASWRESFEAYPPVLDTLRRARADIFAGYLAVERHLAGELLVRQTDADVFFEQAVQRVDDVGRAAQTSGAWFTPGPGDQVFSANLDRYRQAVVKFQEMARQGLGAAETSRQRYGVERQAAFAAMDKLADSLDADIQRRITIAANRQDRLNNVLFWVWLSFLTVLGVSLSLAGARRRKAEMAMLESEEKYRSLFDQVRDVILLVDEETGLILDCNQAVTTEWGYDREELIGHDPVMLRLPPPHSGLSGPTEVGYPNGRQAVQREVRLVTRFGDVRDVSVKTGYFVLDNRQVRLDIFRDITERKQDETALREREAMLRNLGDSLPDGIIYKMEVRADGSRRFLYMSQGVERILGQPSSRILEDAQNLFRRIIPEDLERLRQAELQSLGCLATLDVQVRILAGDGAVRWGQFRAAPRRDTEGVVVFDGVFFDVTTQKRTEEHLRQAKAEAEAASLAKSEFLANISHEVRTPINGVLGMLQLLESSELSPLDAEHVATALVCGRGLVRVLSDILDFSLVEAGRLTPRQDTCDLRGLVADVLGVLSIECAKKNINVTLRVAENVPAAIVTDAARLRQILFNVVGNAVKFTPMGSIRLAVETVSRRGDILHLLFSVRDTGVGIPPERIDAIFEPFTQLDGSLTRKYGGTGLGLGIVKRLVGLLDGHALVESEVGVGTVFSFTIRCRQSDSPASPVERPVLPPRQKTAAGGAIRVLVVEDEAVNRIATVAMLKKLGFAAKAVEDGDQVPEALAGDCFDVVLMDIQMPRVSGDEATRRIRQGRHPGVDPTIPVIALTAHAMEGDRERYLACGMDDYLSKPVDLMTLGKAVARAAAARADPVTA